LGVGTFRGEDGTASVTRWRDVLQQRKAVPTRVGSVCCPSSIFLPKSQLEHLVWRCPGISGEQCSFFLWVEHETAAKEWLHISQLPPVPQTPTKTSVSCGDPDRSTVSILRDEHSLPQLPETPFTKAKGKRVSSNITNHHEVEGRCDQNLNVNRSSIQPTRALDDPFSHSSQASIHARKAARTSTFSTPGQRFTERLKSHTVSLPTPHSPDHMFASNNKASQPRRLQSLDTSPTPGRFNNGKSLHPEGQSNLTTIVLESIRSDNLELKASTETQLRHKIGLKLDVDETKLRRYEETISEQRERLIELETMVVHLT